MQRVNVGTIVSMPDPILCPSCNASNPAGASWCSLCFTPFGAAEDHAEPVKASASPQPARIEGEATAPSIPPPPPHPEGEQLALLESGDEAKTWTCRFCDTQVPVGLVQCTTCQQSIYDSFGGQTPEIELDPIYALRRSLLPGGGHYALKQGLTATTILIITFISFGMGLYLLISGEVAYGGMLTFVGMTMWMLAAHDAFRMASGHGDDIFLRPRVLSIVMGVWFVLIVAAARSAQQVLSQ